RPAAARTRRRPAIPWAAQLDRPDGAGPAAADTTEVLVVDRIGLQRANAAFLRALMERVPDRPRRAPDRPRPPAVPRCPRPLPVCSV
ncbi:hypothetical protein BW737_006150, partial [Actinomyces ruminis]